jgi:hypothetical protein
LAAGRDQVIQAVAVHILFDDHQRLQPLSQAGRFAEGAVATAPEQTDGARLPAAGGERDVRVAVAVEIPRYSGERARAGGIGCASCEQAAAAAEVDFHLVEGEGHGEIGPAIVVEIVEYHGQWHLAGAVPAGGVENAGRLGDNDGDGLGAARVGHQVGITVAVHVAQGHRCRFGQHRQGGGGCEGAVALAQKHRQGAVLGVDGDDIVVSVLVQIGGEELGGAHAHGDDVEFVMQLRGRFGQFHGAGP